MSLRKNLKKNNMWSIIKFDKKKFSLLKEDLKIKFGQDIKIYTPKICIENFRKNRLIKKEINLLGDYLFCFHNNFSSDEKINSLKFTRGLKYILNGHKESQGEIEIFVKKCKEFEDDRGYVSSNFVDLVLNRKYKFLSGPFSSKIFEIINLHKNKIRILMGNLKTSINKKEFLISPL
jgi:hypothetical protein